MWVIVVMMTILAAIISGKDEQSGCEKDTYDTQMARDAAKEYDVNYSHVLQEALKQHIGITEKRS